MRGALTFRLPADPRAPLADILGQVDEVLAEVRTATARAYGIGSPVSPRDQSPCRFVAEDGCLAMEIRVTVDTPDGGRLLTEEIRRRKLADRMFQSASFRAARGIG